MRRASSDPPVLFSTAVRPRPFVQSELAQVGSVGAAGFLRLMEDDEG